MSKEMGWDEIDRLNTARNKAHKKIREAIAHGKEAYARDIMKVTNPCVLSDSINRYLNSLETISDIVSTNKDAEFIDGITTNIAKMINTRSL